jgi:L-fuconolactonase
MVQDIADPDWLLRSDLDAVFSALVDLDLTFDALITPEHLPRLRQRMERHPDLNVVIDHAAKPRIGTGHRDAWRAALAELAEDTACVCKLSGLMTQASAQQTPDDIRPYGEDLITLLGPSRLMWGSDWPVLTLASDYEQWFGLTKNLIAELSPAEQDEVLGLTAMRFCGLEGAKGA